MRFWLPYEIRIRTPRLELRLPDLELLEELAGLAAQGVHPPEFMPFDVPWTDVPSPQLERRTLQWNLLQVAQSQPDNWSFDPVVLHQGRVIGTQGIRGKEFAISRSVGTGSWLGRQFQGQGFGKEMRAAILEFAFSGLGALEAHSGAFADNQASLGVSRALGYEGSVGAIHARRGQEVRHIDLHLTRERWLQHRKIPVQLEMVEQCLDFFGAEPSVSAGGAAPVSSGLDREPSSG